MIRSVAMLILLGTACAKNEPAPEPTPPLAQVLPNIPLPPGATPMTSEAGGDAIRIVVSSTSPADTVIAFYRATLSAPPFRLINEAKSGSVTSFYVEQDGPPMWVTVEPVGTATSLVTIAGARVDSTQPRDKAIARPVGADGRLLDSKRAPITEP